MLRKIKKKKIKKKKITTKIINNIKKRWKNCGKVTGEKRGCETKLHTNSNHTYFASRRENCYEVSLIQIELHEKDIFDNIRKNILLMLPYAALLT